MAEPNGFTALADQLEASAADIARVIAGYYISLLKNGVPPETAEKLTAELNRCMWSQIDAANRKETP